MKGKRVRPLSLAIHEFHIALRRFGSADNYIDIYKDFHEERSNEMERFAKFLISICIIFLSLFLSGKTLSISLPFFHIDIPKVFIVLLFSSSIALISFMAINLVCLNYIILYLERKITDMSVYSPVFESVITKKVSWSFAYPPLIYSMFQNKRKGTLCVHLTFFPC